MKKEQTKSLILNIITGSVVVGLFVTGYFVFVKKEPVVDTTVASVVDIAQQTTVIVSQIDSTIKELGELESAVESSTAIFEDAAFKNLQDYSVKIPEETIGRDNPFVPTAWKVKLKALETVVNSGSQSAVVSGASQASSQTASVAGIKTKTKTPPSLLDGFGSGL